MPVTASKCAPRDVPSAGTVLAPSCTESFRLVVGESDATARIGDGIEVQAMTLINEAPLVNMKHRYVATTACPIGTPDQAECAALADRIFETDEAACAALIAHLGGADCHTREQLAHVVGDTQGRTYSY